jgi:two-component system chemotaxis response regulator CheB
MASEVSMASKTDSSIEELDSLGKRVPLTCPECGGSLWEMENGGPRFRCHTGHAYSLNSLAAEQAIQVEAALWAGLRRLEESERLSRHMEVFARSRGNDRSANYHAEMAKSSASHAETLRALLREATAPTSDRAAVNE